MFAPPPRIKHQLQRAFTLVELLSTIAVMATLMAITGPAMTSLMDSSNLSNGGQMLADQFGLARQIASAKNRPIEVRIIEMSGSPSSAPNAFQLWMEDPATGNTVPISKLAAMPPNTVVGLDQTEVSPALERLPHTELVAGSDEANAMPGASAYYSLQIAPGGTVSPAVPVSEMNEFYLTVVTANSATSTSLPSNYVTVQVNPTTGTPLLYRP